MGQLAKVRVTVRFRLKKWPQMIVLDMSSIILMFALLKDSNILVLLYYQNTLRQFFFNLIKFLVENSEFGIIFD